MLELKVNTLVVDEYQSSDFFLRVEENGESHIHITVERMDVSV